jgi:hypothetical protein
MPLVELMAVDPKRVGEIWPAAQPLIAKAYAKNDFDVPDDILADLRKGARLLWLAVDTEGGNLKILAAMLTQLFKTKAGKVCKMQECGGEQMQTWKHLRKRVEKYAREEGCDRIMCEGRVGWERIMPDYERVAVVLEKRI